MNLVEEFTGEEKELLSNANIRLENREYSKREIDNCVRNIGEFIMEHSTKNGDIGKLTKKYRTILDKISK